MSGGRPTLRRRWRRFAAIGVALAGMACPQARADAALTRTIRALDDQLFDAFNRCADAAQLRRHASLFAPDVEFFHGTGGVTWTRQAMIANTRRHACGRYTRERIEASLAVSPIRGYGALATGTHRFCSGTPRTCAGEADFAMLWRETKGHWVVTRVLSYGHRAAPASPVAADMPALMRAHRVPSVSIARIENLAVVSAEAWGTAREGLPATPATPYNIASLTKPISAEVALRLADAGRLSLDEPMSAHWIDPDLAGDPRAGLLTPRLALSHRTGLPNWRQGALRFDRDPGTAYGYSGEGFEALARFIQNKTGQTIDRWAESLVFGPAGMRQTTYTRQAWLREDRVALPHDDQGHALPAQFADRPLASDDAWSTPSDYALLMLDVMHGRGLSQAQAAERQRVQTDRRGAVCARMPAIDCPTEAGFGLGWESLLIGGNRYLMHTGADDGTFTFAYLSPDTRSGMVIFTNSRQGANLILPILRAGGRDAAFVNFLQRSQN